MTDVKVQIAYGNPKIAAMVAALAAYHAKGEDDNYEQGVLSFQFDSEEKANNFVSDLEEYLKPYVRT